MNNQTVKQQNMFWTPIICLFILATFFLFLKVQQELAHSPNKQQNTLEHVATNSDSLQSPKTVKWH